MVKDIILKKIVKYHTNACTELVTYRISLTKTYTEIEICFLKCYPLNLNQSKIQKNISFSIIQVIFSKKCISYSHVGNSMCKIYLLTY